MYADLLVDWLIAWLLDWLIDWLIDWLECLTIPIITFPKPKMYTSMLYRHDLNDPGLTTSVDPVMLGPIVTCNRYFIHLSSNWHTCFYVTHTGQRSNMPILKRPFWPTKQRKFGAGKSSERIGLIYIDPIHVRFNKYMH